MKIAFFCSSRENIRIKYENKVIKLFEKLNDIKSLTHVVYGGGNSGIMGSVYNFFKDKKIIESHNLEQWRFKDNPDENIYTSILKRQKMLLLNSDIYIILPGGAGTLSEFFDAFILNEIEHKNKPIIIYNCDNYYDKLFDLVIDMIDNKNSFTNHSFMHITDNIENIYDIINNYINLDSN